MAILKNLLVNGASRFLGHVYMQDLDVAGTTNFGTLAATNITASGTLAVTGATTLSSTLSVSGTATFAKTTDLSGTANNSPALIVGGTASQAHIELDSNEIQGKNSGTTTADLYLNNDGGKVLLSNSGKIYANNGTFTAPTLSSTNGSITNAVISNARVTDELIVDGVLETNEMRTNIIKAVGGQLYVAPTFVATNSTTIVCTAVTASTVSFTITDSTAINSLTYGGANWNNGSKLKFTAKITSNNIATNPPIITFSSAEGTLTSNMNATASKLTFTVEYNNANTYFKAATGTNLTYSDMSVMMYQIKSGDNYLPVGIYIKSYGNDNKNSYIDVYGGTTTYPNARLGLLNGLKDPDDPNTDLTINGTTVSGWGLMSSYAYLKGRIVSKSGSIGGWDIGNTTLTSGTLGTNNSMWLTTANVPTATKFAGASSALSNWRVGVGSKFGVLDDGTMYCSNAIISGDITATSGTIGGAQIVNGTLEVPAANITGTVTATQIDASGLTIGQSQVTNLTTDLESKASSSDLEELTNKVDAVYGTSSTGATTAAKVVTCNNFELYDGALIAVNFANANTSSAKITLNINSKGAKDVYVANGVTSATNQLLWGQKATITFRYDGAKFIVLGEPRTWYNNSSTAARTAAKIDASGANGTVVCKGAVVKLSMTYENTATSPTLNVNGTGAKAIYAGNSTVRPTTANGLGWTAGSTVEFVFDGQYWRIGDTVALVRAHNAQTTANNSAKTATNYITTITNAGIKVHDEDNDTDYVQITSDGTYIYKGSSQMASFGTDILLGQTSGTNRNVFIDADSGVSIRKGTTVLANYGDTITINHGASGNQALTLDSTNGLQMYALDGTTVAAQLNASGLTVNSGFFGGSSGFTISTNKLYSNGKSSNDSINEGIYIQSGSSGGIYLGAYDSNKGSCPFQVTANGVLNARNANISGDINATAGKIGNFIINESGLIGTKVTGEYSDEDRPAYSQSINHIGLSVFPTNEISLDDELPYYYDYAFWIGEGVSGANDYVIDNVPFYINTDGSLYAEKATIGANSKTHLTISNDALDMYYNNSSILHFGYGNGINVSGTVSEASYYSIGMRRDGTIGNDSAVIGYNSIASGFCSMAIGFQLTSSANYSVATGFSTTASGFSSTAIGDQTISSGRTSTAMGFKTQASGDYSTSMGRNVIASGDYSFAVGVDSTASGYSSTSIGGNAIASGWGSIAMGRNVISSGDYSFATGLRTIVSNMCNVVIGKYNRATRSGSGTDDNPYIYTDPGDYALIIGNGTGDETENRSNALTVDWDGNLWIAGTLKGKIGAQYGTSSTTASTQVKSVTCDGFQLYNGALITIKFSTANTYASGIVKLNINSTGEKNVWVAGAVTGTSNQLLWGANATITFRYDGAEFIVVGDPVTYYGASTTAASTAAKTDATACTSAVIRKGVVVRLSMTNANTAVSPTLNINGTGAKAIYAGLGTSTRPLVSNGLSWTDGSTVGFVFDGQYWRVGETAGLASAYVAQTTATNAAKTATDYITPVTIDNNNYIRIHNASDTTGAITVDQNGNLVASGSIAGTNITASGSISEGGTALSAKYLPQSHYSTVTYTDVGYINGAFTNTGSSIGVKYSKIGNIVTASGQIHTGSNIAANAYIEMFKLPYGYGPNVQIFFTAYGDSGQRSVMWYIDPGNSGWIRLYTSNGMVANTTYTFCVSYVQ